MFIFLAGFSAGEETLSLNFQIDKKDNVEITNITYSNAKPIINQAVSDYYMLFTDSMNKEVYRLSFFVSFSVETFAPSDIDATTAAVFIRVPFEKIRQARYLSIYHGTNLLVKADLKKYLCNKDNKCAPDKGENAFNCIEDCGDKGIVCGNKICENGENENCKTDCQAQEIPATATPNILTEECGNNICENNENYLACDLDCPSGASDSFCDSVSDGICDPDCNEWEDSDCKKPKKSNFLIIFFTVFLIVMIAGIIYFLKFRKKTQ
ncbi:MAG: hypothetical protein V1859_09315 [archaeon]